MSFEQQAGNPESSAQSRPPVVKSDSAPLKRDDALRPEETYAGRLFGWLVSYTNTKGVATELREGKFFVTRSSLKENDLIIGDESVSTPHAMITVSIDTGLQVQDLMSASGFYVKKRGSETFQREYYTTVVEHGDSVRFGAVEYLVSLVAHVGTR
jgi:hypothetical protein